MREGDVRELQASLKALNRRQRQAQPPSAGLARTSVRVLGAIARRPDGRAQPGQLADELVMTTSNVAAALRELEHAGCISRERDAGDTRRVNVTLTDAGRTVVERHRADRAGWLAEAIDALLRPEEQAALVEAGRLIRRLAEYEGTRAEREAS